MIEKVLGFKLKNAVWVADEFYPAKGTKGCFEIEEKNLVPVVSVEWMEKYCKEHYTRRVIFKGTINETELKILLVNSLLSAAKKEAEK